MFRIGDFMFQIGDYVMLKENEANDHLSRYYGQVFKVKSIDYVGGEWFINAEDDIGGIRWYPDRLKKVCEAGPIDFDDVMNLL